MVQGCLSRIWIGFSRFATATLIWPRPSRNPWILIGFSGSAEHGFVLSEADVFAAQQREHHARTAAELQQDHAAESRRLRNFIHG